MSQPVHHMNPNGNPVNPIGEQIAVRVVIELDMVEGPWHREEDYINHMFNNLRYIHGATVLEIGKRDDLYGQRYPVVNTRKNTSTYDQGKFSKHADILFDIQMDGVPGRFNQPEDFIDYLTHHSYAKFAEQVKIAK